RPCPLTWLARSGGYFFYFIRIIVWAVTNDTFGIILLWDVSFFDCGKYNMLLKWKSGNGIAYAEK
ncbi:MAG: hypothetical protein WCJ40_18355, partial [Planctomycetota bacterium]